MAAAKEEFCASAISRVGQANPSGGINTNARPRMRKKTKKPKNEPHPQLLIMDWDMYDHPDPEKRRAYRLWLVLRHESSWGRSVNAQDLCRRLECSLPQLGAALTRRACPASRIVMRFSIAFNRT